MIDHNSPIYPMVNGLFEEDCLACMKRIPDGSVDMVLCDLPYGLTQNEWDCYIPLDQLWEQYLRIVKPNGAIVLTSQGVFTSKLILSQPRYYKYSWVWEKSKPTNFLNAKKQPLRKHENVCVFYRKQPVYHPQMTKGEPYDKGVRKNQLSGSYGDFQPVHVASEGERYPTDILYVKTAESEGEVVHPTQKPVELGRYFIRTYSDPGDVVLDNTFGSGSFLVAALLEGRNFIGIEKNEDVALFKKEKIDYIQVARERLRQAWEGLDGETRRHLAGTNLIREFQGARPGPAPVRQNERSWAIELISRLNALADRDDLAVKRAGGETTISAGRGSTMFPDVLLYGDRERTVILQGWELKMPDVPIEDETFIKDAQRKALALNLNSCLIWNFTYAVLYVRDGGDGFKKLKQWSDTAHIRTRQDVETFRADWEALLERVLLEVNGYFTAGRFRNAFLGDVISETAITALIRRNKAVTAEHLKSAACRDAVMEAYLKQWWKGIRSEYEHDERDPCQAYAKTVILNWAIRIVFAHIIKGRQNGALAVDEITYMTTPEEAGEIFRRITAKCDFYNVFSALEYGEVLPNAAWQDLVEFSLFLRANGIEHLDQRALQSVLEDTVAVGKREINGQFATPLPLARLLARLTVRDWSGQVLDCCCGTGAISKAVIQIKKERFPAREAVETVWACDKYRYPLQIAGVSMTDADTVRLANRLFQHNALTLTPGEDVTVTDPETGGELRLALPSFDAVVSNLPFVPFEIIPDDDKAEIEKIPGVWNLDKRSDLYCYVASKIADVLKPGGMLGIITSNSWLGTNAGAKLMRVLEDKYHIRQVHISGRGRWFQNADVVTTLMVLEKRGGAREEGPTDFWLWQKSLEELTASPEDEEALVNGALLGQELDPSVAALSRYSWEQIQELLLLNVCSNALFHHADWLVDIKDKLIPISRVFRTIRGSRRGWDPMFYPKEGEHHIEDVYLKKVLVNARKVKRLTAEPDRDAFCCGESIEELRSLGHRGALAWIEKFEDQKNGVGKPLPAVLKRKNMEWYMMRDNEIAEFFTMLNPDRRFFFGRFETPSFINQRLTGLTHRDGYSDLDLYHALLNSILTLFYIEACGFGRGQGVLDIKKDSVARCYMLDPGQVSAGDRRKILRAFEKLKARDIMKLSDELRDPDRLAFEHTVLRSFGIDGYFDRIKDSLLSMQRARAAVKL